jgi:hypothetical protein
MADHYSNSGAGTVVDNRRKALATPEPYVSRTATTKSTDSYVFGAGGSLAQDSESSGRDCDRLYLSEEEWRDIAGGDGETYESCGREHFIECRSPPGTNFTFEYAFHFLDFFVRFGMLHSTEI